uniref:Basic helix-loop-helix and HMG box domain-containing protein 1 isoform X4 n=1 Tax=Geotrypetes seraphini TaxID=260995 RepID=A0A6P8RVC4_GEOSA|nr:basic helix-loop-helix and HMG box domain-containing protein 1 isoform X4 [Geotrypetes seraphini]
MFERSRGPGSARETYCKNTNTLKELALLLPVPLQTSSRKLTKKEILQRVLLYIKHLQRSIDAAKSVLRYQHVDHEVPSSVETDQLVGLEMSGWKKGKEDSPPCTPPRIKRPRVLGACKKPRKSRHPKKTEWKGAPKRLHGSLLLEKAPQCEKRIEDLHARESKEWGGLHVNPSYKNEVVSSSTTDSMLEMQRHVQDFHQSTSITLLEMAEPSIMFCATECYKGREEEESQEDDDCSTCDVHHDLGLQTQGPYQEDVQELVNYRSSSEEEPDSSPWLTEQSPLFSCHGQPLRWSPGKSWCGNSWSSKDLGLSPSLFTSPGRLLLGQVLQEGPENLSQVLFEDVRLSPQFACSAFSKGLPGNLQAKDTCPGLDCTASSSEENDDYTWTPYQRSRCSHHGNRKRKKGHGFRQLKTLKKLHYPFPLKKKCVNGFIMFCRLNRKQYIRARPGTASTTATKELAYLWRVMSKQERRPYCIKARKFSRLHNRVMRQDHVSSEEEEEVTPKPLHLLLAEKTLYSVDFHRFVPSPLYHQYCASLHPTSYTI